MSDRQTQILEKFREIRDPFTMREVTPVAGPGFMFRAQGDGRRAGWTSDPTQADTMPSGDASREDVYRATVGIWWFIHSLFSRDPVEAFKSPEEAANAAREWAGLDPLERPSEGLSPLPGATTPEDPSEAVSGDPREPDEAFREYVEQDREQTKRLEKQATPWTRRDFVRDGSPEHMALVAEALADSPEKPLTETEQRKFDNMADLAENANTEPARRFWTETLRVWLEQREEVSQ